jgi:hypothetical protein
MSKEVSAQGISFSKAEGNRTNVGFKTPTHRLLSLPLALWALALTAAWSRSERASTGGTAVQWILFWGKIEMC